MNDYKGVVIPEGWFRVSTGATLEDGDMFWAGRLLGEAGFKECEPWLNELLPEVLEDDFVIRRLEQ